jgi:putative membrane protein
MMPDATEPLRLLCQYDTGTGYGPSGWTHMMSPMGGGVFMLLLVVLVFILVSRIMHRTTGTPETPLNILKKRYAKGEITREDFERMKQDLRD